MKSALVKILIIVVILSLTVSLLSACGKATENEDETTDSVTTEEPTTEAVVTEEPTTESVTTEPATEAQTEYDFSGAASSQLQKIAKKIAMSDNYLIFTVGDSVTQGQQASNPKTTDYTAMFTKKLCEVFPEKSVFRCDGVAISNDSSGKWTNVNFAGVAKRGVRIQTGNSGEITVARCGLGGDTVAKVINRTDDFVNKELRGQTAKLITICLGINDSWPSTNVSPEEYKGQLSVLIDKIYEGQPDVDIILMTPTYITDNNTRPLVDYATAMKELAVSRDLAYIDLNAMFNENYAKSNPEDWLADNCHPNDAGYNAIANEMIRCLFGIELE